MAIPCIPGLRSHSDCIFCSAPEMTTVSKPKRNPANAAVNAEKTIRPLMPTLLPSARRQIPQVGLAHSRRSASRVGK
jgi:hypothetical protein